MKGKNCIKTKWGNWSQVLCVYSCSICFIHAPWVWTSSPEGTRQGKEELREPTCLPLDCVLAARRGWRHLRHITGPLIKTHVRQGDRHGKTVWKKLLGIKYIVTTWFQRFINKLTDHLVSIRSDRSTNPGISALGLVGGGRRWLSMRGDIEGKSPCRFQGGPLLTLFQRGSMRVQTPFTPPVFQSLWDGESSRVSQKSTEATCWPSVRKERSVELAVFPACTNGAVNYTNKHNWLSLLTSVHLLALTSAETKEKQWQVEEKTQEVPPQNKKMSLAALVPYSVWILFCQL